MSRKIIAQRATTGEFLEFDVPLDTPGGTRVLSAVGQMTGTIAPDVGNLRAADGRLLLEEWGTLLYEEVDGEIRWGGIVHRSSFSGAEWTVEAANFATYPHGSIYDDTIRSTAADPIVVMRRIWQDVQRHPDSDLGVRVVGDGTDRRLGSAEEPYLLAWYDNVDCGQEIDNLAAETPFDWVERHYWDGDTIAHEIVTGYPRLGRLRDDLAFVMGENVVSVPTPEVDGAAYASHVIGIGAGEGAGAVRSTTARTTGRLRRTRVVTAKDVTSRRRLDSLIAAELASTAGPIPLLDSITVRDHPHAEFGSFDVGDDIVVDAHGLPWLGDMAITRRIVTMTPEGLDRLTLTLA